MRSCCLFLLLLLCAAPLDGTELNPHVLEEIVSTFATAAGLRPSDLQLKQFGFLMALTPKQCTGDNRVWYRPFNQNTGVHVTGSPNFFTNVPDLNYMAVYPYIGNVCSEKKILFSQDQNQPSPAQSFANNADKILRAGGCVLFFTTNTPCLEKCFSGKQDCDIVSPLLAQPFSNWGYSNINRPIHKYFIYTKVFGRDNRNLVSIKEGFTRLDNSKQYLFRKCSKDANSVKCIPCDANNNFCL